MSDIVERLRRWVIAIDAAPASDIMDQAAAEIERLRSRPCPYVTGTVTRYCALTPFTLSDAEREFLQNLRGAYEELANVNAAAQKEALEHAATLRGLLERLGGER